MQFPEREDKPPPGCRGSKGDSTQAHLNLYFRSLRARYLMATEVWYVNAAFRQLILYKSV